MVDNLYAQRDINVAQGNLYVTNSYNSAKVTSLIADVVNSLSNISFPSPNVNDKIKLPLEVEEKIKLNNLKSCRFIIEEYRHFFSKLDSIYADLTNFKISAKEKVLHRLRNAYIEELGNYLNNNCSKLDVVKANADNIFMGIKNKIKDIVIFSSNNESSEEEIDIAINIVLADAFVNCQIMESEVE